METVFGYGVYSSLLRRQINLVNVDKSKSKVLHTRCKIKPSGLTNPSCEMPVKINLFRSNQDNCVNGTVGMCIYIDIRMYELQLLTIRLTTLKYDPNFFNNSDPCRIFFKEGLMDLKNLFHKTFSDQYTKNINI